MPMNAIELRGVTKTYTRKGKEKVRAVDGLSLDIPEGKIFGILGPNGAGKTTTIKMICGLVHPDEGDISISGHDIRNNHSDTMSQIGAVLDPRAGIEGRGDALAGRHHMVVPTDGTHPQVLDQLFSVGDFATGVAFCP